MPKLLSDRTVALVRRTTEKMLTETCDLQRETGNTDSMGAELHTWETIASDVPCRVISVGRRQGSQIQNLGSQEALTEMYRLITPYGTAFDVDDLIAMSDGRVFQVVQVGTGMTDKAFADAVIMRVR